MAAIVTNQFRLDAAKKFVTDVTDTSKYYMFIGRSEEWDTESQPDDPFDNTFSTVTTAYQRMQSMKLITGADITYAVPRKQWIQGRDYSAYDDRETDIENTDFYVISDNNHVYICLKAGPAGSQRNPDLTGTQTVGVIDYTSYDGYIWKYLFTVSTDFSNKFLTSAFVPVRYIDTQPVAGSDTASDDQWDVQDNAVAGAVYNVKISNGGSGYTTAPNITVTGDGNGFAATAVITGGVVTDVVVTNPGSGYNHIDLRFDSGTATCYGVIGPKGGFGADPRNDLRAHYITVNQRFVYDDGEKDFITGNDFRQIGIIRNPFNAGTTTVASAPTLKGTYEMVVPPGAAIANDSIIEGQTSGARAIVDLYNSSSGLLRFHQTNETGFVDFIDSSGNEENIRVVGQTSDYAIDTGSVSPPEIEPYSGEIIFLENRTAVQRAADQIETIKLVLEF